MKGKYTLKRSERKSLEKWVKKLESIAKKGRPNKFYPVGERWADIRNKRVTQKRRY